MIDWAYGLAGGLMIGCAGAMFLLINGRIMGASGILGGLIDRTGWSNGAERAVFVASLILVPGVIAGFTGGAESYLSDNWLVVAIAGLLVGVGTRLAGGCTSGHGVCGISRLTLRGIAATVIYIIAGAVMLSLVRHLWGLI
ncbi:MAG: YeeE/YedE family protein [Rhodobacteraceae bacterium]|nr:YeeE/YedE family protein [Paracoccaceae bacterium]